MSLALGKSCLVNLLGQRNIFAFVRWLWAAESSLSSLSAAQDIMTYLQSFSIMGLLIGIWKTTSKFQGLDASLWFSSKVLTKCFEKTFLTCSSSISTCSPSP